MVPGIWSRYFIAGVLSLLSLLVDGQYSAPFGKDAGDYPGSPGQPVYSIQWVGQYPAQKEKRERDRSTTWLTDLLFGKKPADLVKPMSVVAMNPDTFWIADQGSGSILRVFNQVGEMTQLKHEEVESLPSIVGSCFIPGNKTLFTDSRLNTVFWFEHGQKALHILNDSLRLEQPTGIAYSAVNREIWVVETKAHRISVLDENGEMIRHIGGRGNAPGMFNFPTYIWIDNSGTVYVVDAMNFRIQVLDKEGAFISDFGEIGDASGYFSRPKGVATDSYGHIYIVDALFHVVQVFDREGNYLYAFGSQGEGPEQFWMPTGIYIDKRNFIYIADSYNSRVQIFELTDTPRQ
ncbi:MAG: 6-bladed beta-propeller [Bacteroidota bacterium]